MHTTVLPEVYNVFESNCKRQPLSVAPPELAALPVVYLASRSDAVAQCHFGIPKLHDVPSLLNQARPCLYSSQHTEEKKKTYKDLVIFEISLNTESLLGHPKSRMSRHARF